MLHSCFDVDLDGSSVHGKGCCLTQGCMCANVLPSLAAGAVLRLLLMAVSCYTLTLTPSNCRLLWRRGGNSPWCCVFVVRVLGPANAISLFLFSPPWVRMRWMKKQNDLYRKSDTCKSKDVCWGRILLLVVVFSYASVTHFATSVYRIQLSSASVVCITLLLWVAFESAEKRTMC